MMFELVDSQPDRFKFQRVSTQTSLHVTFFPQTTTAEQLLEFFKQVGDVKFVRMAGDETQPTRFAFVEFVEQESVARALTFNGVMFGDRPLKYVFLICKNLHKTNRPWCDSYYFQYMMSLLSFRVNHSNNAIVKPPELTPQAAAKELENVMKRVREAQSTIAAAIEPGATWQPPYALYIHASAFKSQRVVVSWLLRLLFLLQ